jgi:hypothetical protein
VRELAAAGVVIAARRQDEPPVLIEPRSTIAGAWPVFVRVGGAVEIGCRPSYWRLGW